jgi:hypothetical protein
MGYFSLSELKSVKGPLGLPIERDLHFELKTLQVLMKKQRIDRGEKIEIPVMIFRPYFIYVR